MPAGSTRPERFDPWARRRARRLLLQALYQWQLADGDPGGIERQFRDEADFERIDQAFFNEVLRGVVRERARLDALIEPLLDRKLRELDQVERALLRLGTFELAERLDVPFKVVIDECVSLARTFGGEESHRYINGVLDKLARQLRPLEAAPRG